MANSAVDLGGNPPTTFNPQPTSFIAQSGGQFDGWPLWAKIAVTGTSVTVITGLLIFLVITLVSGEGKAVANFERLVDKFDAIIEKHDARQREWMRSHGDKITTENEKTRSVLSEMSLRQGQAAMENARLHEAQLLVLKQIRDEKKMP